MDREGLMIIEVVREDADVSVLAFSGEFDVASIAYARRVLDRHLTERRHVELELTGLEFIDSSGLQVFVEARHRQIHNGGSFTIGAMSRASRRLLNVTGLTEFLCGEIDGDSPTT